MHTVASMKNKKNVMDKQSVRINIERVNGCFTVESGCWFGRFYFLSGRSYPSIGSDHALLEFTRSI